MRLFCFARSAIVRQHNLNVVEADKGYFRGRDTMTELLDLACYGSFLFLMWFQLWVKVYYREDDEE